MINTKQIIVFLSLVFMVPVFGMQPGMTKQERSRANKKNRHHKQEIKHDKYAQYIVPNMQSEEVIEVASVENLPQQPVAQVSEVSHAGAIIENQNQSLLSAPKQNLSPASYTPEVINLGQLIAQAIQEEGILRDADGNIIAQVTDADDATNAGEHIVIEVLNHPSIDTENPPVVEAPVNNLGPDHAEISDNAHVYSLRALRKPIMVGLGVCGIATLGWKLYQKTSHYQCGLLQKWQMQVADAIVDITSGVKGNKQILPIELSQLTRLTDVEREQLAQAHDSLVVAFDKAQQTVAQAATEDVAHAPVVTELKVAHAQWDNVMNNCKNVVEQGSMRFW